jgi:hypothetical protein
MCKGEQVRHSLPGEQRWPGHLNLLGADFSKKGAEPKPGALKLNVHRSLELHAETELRGERPSDRRTEARTV